MCVCVWKASLRWGLSLRRECLYVVSARWIEISNFLFCFLVCRLPLIIQKLYKRYKLKTKPKNKKFSIFFFYVCCRQFCRKLLHKSALILTTFQKRAQGETLSFVWKSHYPMPLLAVDCALWVRMDFILKFDRRWNIGLNSCNAFPLGPW